ncbi:hypothetical protein ACROYT_G033835 [Oculina patagonica]
MPSKKKLRSRCPVGFEAVSFKEDSQECPTVEDVLSDDNSSLWLIKVPHDFDVSSLSGQKVVMNGTQDLRPTGAQENGKRYEIQSKTDCSAELSSFTVLLPSLQQKSLCAAGSFSGQMSVIRSVPVPPPTLPETSPSVQRQPPSEVIRKWKPFGYKKPGRKSKREANKTRDDLSVKEKKTKEPNESPKNGSRKHSKERKATDLEETMNSNASPKKKGDSPKRKKKKDEAKHEVDLTRVKIEPDADGNSHITSRNGEQSSHSPRKRKAEKNESQQSNADLTLTTSKKKKKLNNSDSVDTVVKQEPVTPDKNSSRDSKRHQNAVADKGEPIPVKQKKIISKEDSDLLRVKIEPIESHKKKKHSKTKTC